MTATAAPTCKAALAEATRLYPGRNRAADGILPSAQHHKQNPTSDHETGDAFDLADDPDHGCKAHAMASDLVVRRDARVKYVISAGYIWRSYDRPATATRPFLKAWDAERYTGRDPHTGHIHVSILSTARDDCSPWWATFAPAVAPAPPVINLEDPMLFRDTDDAAAFAVVYAYSILLGRPVENLQMLAWRMQQFKDHGFAQLWDDIAKSDEAREWAAKLEA